MQPIIQIFPHPLKVVITVLLAAALCGWFAADPWAALRFWSGVLIGAWGAIVGWQKLKTASERCAKRRFKVFVVVLLVWFALAWVPQRDIPVIAAPFGIWLSLTVAMGIEQFRRQRLRSREAS
ncbi:hypothetical protein [Dyella flagellata]|uniref:hypothetical protein n=1 Tax=Dyella flagellata TaxID=1867833 RepID=UPI0024E0979F|nr:hypothetical protein [Dyella flagellata]